MMQEEQTGQAKNTIFVTTFTDGILDPKKPMLGPVRDGGTIIANTAPGCWGPMITPSLRGIGVKSALDSCYNLQKSQEQI